VANAVIYNKRHLECRLKEEVALVIYLILII
jgi:hypothetical protein